LAPTALGLHLEQAKHTLAGRNRVAVEGSGHRVDTVYEPGGPDLQASPRKVVQAPPTRTILSRSVAGRDQSSSRSACSILWA